MNKQKTYCFRPYLFVLAVLTAVLFNWTTTEAVRAEDTPLATVTVIDGDGAQMQRNGAADWEPASEEMDIYQGDKIKTDKVTKVEAQLPDNSIVRISELSSITFGVPEISGTKLDMEQGRMWCKLKKLKTGVTFEVVTPTVTAGVRGTTFWVDAQNPEENIIGVEDGQVEAVRGRKRIMLNRLMRISALRDRLEEADYFDPEKRQRWEQFTTRIIKKRMERFREVVGEYRDNSVEAAEKGAELVRNITELDKKTRELVAGLEVTMKKQERLTQETDKLVGKAKQVKKNRQTRLKKYQLRRLKSKVDRLIKTSAEVADDFKTSKEAFTKHFLSVQEYLQQTRELDTKISALKKQQNELKRKTERKKKRREFDPDWPQLQKIHAVIEKRVAEVIENTERSDKILSRFGEATQEKAVTLFEHTEKLKTYIDENKTRIRESVKSLGKTHAKLVVLQQAIDKELEK